MLQDIRFGLRGLRRTPGFTALAVLTLALGVGSCLAIFSIVNGVLLRPLPYPQPERVVSIWELSAKGVENRIAFPNYVDWRNESRGFEAMSAYWRDETPILLRGQARRAQAVVATADFFRIFGVAPALGRVFTPDDATDAPHIAVVSHAFWRDVLGAPSDLAGQRVTVDEDQCDVVGVMPPGFAFPAATEIWVASAMPGMTSRTAHNFDVVGRLRADVSLASAQQELQAITARLKSANPDMHAVSARLIDLRDTLTGDSRTPLYLLMGAVLLVLLTACANLASTLLARATTRHREMAVRASLGANRPRLIRQMLIESLLLATLGGVAGLVLARLLMPVLIALAPASLPRTGDVQIDLTVTLAALLLTMVTSVAVGLAPALQASRVDLRGAMSDASRGSTSQRAGRARALLVSAEVAVACVLLVSAGLLIKSMAAVLQQPLGFEPHGVLTVEIPLPGATYGGDAREPQVTAIVDRILTETRALPGVASAGFATSLPVGSAPNGAFAVTAGATPMGDALYRVVDRDLFQTLRLPLLAGRLFEASDRPADLAMTTTEAIKAVVQRGETIDSVEHAAIINKTLADRYWPGRDPLGQRLRPLGMDKYGPITLRVVGVVADAKGESLTRPVYPEIFVFHQQRPARARYGMLAVRAATGDAAALSGPIRDILRRVEPGIPPKFQTFDERIARTSDVAERAFMMRLLSGFGLLALVLTAVGLYGVLAYSVAQRTPEIGVRMALGATRTDIITLVFRQATTCVALGLAAGLAGAWAMTGLLRSFLFEVGAADPLVLVMTCAAMLLTTVAASYVPAWRASRVDPQTAMRAD